MFFQHHFSTEATDVTVGLHPTAYSVEEGDSFAFVCMSVLSGSTAGRTISIDYQTTDGDALGMAELTDVYLIEDVLFL